MKYINTLILLCSLSLFFSCSSDEEIDFTGNYVVSALKDECDDPANDGQATSGADGVCLQTSNGEECIDISFTLNADNSFSYVTQTVTNSGGIRLSNAPVTQTGNFTVTDNTITFSGGTGVVLTSNETGTILEWLIVPMTANGCRRSYVFNKSL